MSSEVNPVGFCVDLSHDQTQEFDHQRGLCAICAQIDFVWLTRRARRNPHRCPDPAIVDDGRIFRHLCHFHIGNVQDIWEKRSCPGCRLILSAVGFPLDRNQFLDKATITVQSQRLATQMPNRALNHKDFSLAMEAREVPDIESFIEVRLDDPYSRDEEPQVVGTIIRKEESGLADSDGIESTNLKSEDPVYRGRNVLPEVNTNLIKQWMQSCSLQHDRCRVPVLELSREQTIRLIDVDECRVKSVTFGEKYVALSYVWGASTKPFLIHDTLPRCSSPGGLRDLIIPRTISDAIQLVKSIGERYLWVDSLCIVQDDEDDKKQQLSIMDSIYANAELVVVAAAGGNADIGLPGIGRTERLISQRTEEIGGMHFITAQPSVERVLKKSVWNSRGWTFQEITLSRRVLVFTENLVYWVCQDGAWREDISRQPSMVRTVLNETHLKWPYILRKGTMCRTLSYCNSAEAFSERELTEAKDVLWAFIGILRLQTSSFRKGFIWGLPYERLDATLLWSDKSGCKNVHSRRACHSVIRNSRNYDLPFPSWSWLSNHGPITFQDGCGGNIVSEVTWHEPLKIEDKTSTAYLKSISLKGVASSYDDNLNTSLLAEPTSRLNFMDYGLLHFTAQTAVLILTRAEESGGDRGTRKSWMLGGDRGALLFPSPKEILRAIHALALRCVLGRATAKESRATSEWVPTTIHNPRGKRIGVLDVPTLFFNNKSKRLGEFVLLSSNAEEKADERCTMVDGGVDYNTYIHVHGCGHIESRNVMLIEWDGNVAYRRALGKIEREDWKEVKTQTKTIVLG